MVQGRGVDASLDDTGIKQAELACNRMLNLSIERVYTSKLKRTHETVSKLGMPFDQFEGFDEISWGDQEGVVASMEERNKYADTVKAWRKGQLNLNIGGGESPIDVMKRQKIAMNDVLSQDFSTALVCMHGRAIRILLCWLLKYPLNYMDGFPHANCCYYSLDFTGSQVRLHDFNVTNHLDG